MQIVLVRERDWVLIKDQFTEEEKVELRHAVTAEVICPPGWTIDADH